MKTLVASAAFFLAVTQFHALSVTLDDFSGTTSSDSGNYITLLSYPGPPTSVSPETFTISSGQLQPTSSGNGNTTTYLWNGGQTFALGDTVSIDITNVDGASNLAGLAFTTSPTSANGSGDNYVFVGLIGDVGDSGSSATAGTIDVNTVGAGSSALDFSAGSITESATRTATGFTWSFSGPGLTDGPITGSYTDAAYTGQTVYFGINIYGGDSPGAQTVDNLDFISAPEPSTYAMLLGGIALLALAARGRKLFRA